MRAPGDKIGFADSAKVQIERHANSHFDETSSRRILRERISAQSMLVNRVFHTLCLLEKYETVTFCAPLHGLVGQLVQRVLFILFVASIFFCELIIK
jgi:hypothetical protein